MKVNSKPFYVIVDDVNRKEFVKYDVMPYFIDCYRECKKSKPVSLEEFKSFIENNSRYMYWSRTEYEIVLKAWMSKTKDMKIDVHYQVMNNIDLIAQMLMDHVTKSKNGRSS